VLTAALLLVGTGLLALAHPERHLARLPATPALVYLAVGAAAGLALGAPTPRAIVQQAPLALVVTELAVLVSLFAVGLRLRLMPRLSAWKLALLLAGPVMVLAVAAGAVAAAWLLALPVGAAIVLAAILAPTDPVLASEVQIRGEDDRDVVRVALTAEGGLNDGTALPAVMLGLGLAGLHGLQDWWWADLAWPIGGGMAVGAALGLATGMAMRARARRGDPLARDELLYAGGVALAYGAARATGTSAFVVAFVMAITLLLPMHADRFSGPEGPLAHRLHGFGASLERLVEALAVMAVGVALPGLRFDGPTLAFALVLAFVVRPLAVLAVVHRSGLTAPQRRLVAWFGIRGVGSLYYLAFVLEHGPAEPLADTLISATLVAVAASVVLHGVSATGLMAAYQRRGGTKRRRLGGGDDSSAGGG
jgi:NhaP-type Na+/H+ or K+/H+ antiporter